MVPPAPKKPHDDTYDGESLPSLPTPTPLAGQGPAGPALPPGTLLDDRYRIVRFIAAGGMGEVYEAEDKILGTHVALKSIRPELVARAEMAERFRREILLARRVTHRNVCRIFDLGHHVPPAPGV